MRDCGSCAGKQEPAGAEGVALRVPLMVALLVLVEVRLLHARVGYSTSAQRRAAASFAATHLLRKKPRAQPLARA